MRIFTPLDTHLQVILLCTGRSLKALREMLGHSSIKTTMRYAHLSQDPKKEAVKLLDGLTTQNSMSHFVTNLENLAFMKNLNLQQSYNPLLLILKKWN